MTLIGTLQRRALSLGSANALDYAMQFLLPVVLARFLIPHEFGEYRLIWLVIMTVMMLVPMQMPAVLYFFLPRSDAATKRLHVHQTLVYLACAGAIGALAVSGLNPLLPDSVEPLHAYWLMVPAMVVLYSVTLLLDTLPTIEERIGWQVRATLSLSLLRTLTLAYAAYATGDLYVLIWLMIGMLVIKLAVLLAYVGRYHGLGGGWFAADRFHAQFSHAAPLGLAAAMYGLRTQVDQWVAASLFSLTSFAAFSVAAVLGPLVNLCRQSINHVFLPSMSRLHAAGDPCGMVELNSRANVMVALLLYPLLAFAFAFAEELITLVYTATYVAAAPALRVYTVGLAAMIVEVYSLFLLQRDGAYVARLNLALLGVSALLSWQAAQHFGLAGAAAGSVGTLYIDRWLTLRHLARSTGIGLARIQDWRSLGGLLLCAALAATLAWLAVATQAPAAGAVARVLIGGGVLASVYGLLVFLLGLPQRNRTAIAVAQH